MQSLLQQELLASRGPLSGMRIENIQPVSGGCIHESWKIILNDRREFFLKTNTLEAFAILKFEAEGLAALERFSNERFLVIPKVLDIRKLQSFSILLMQWLDLSGGNQFNLGRGLALLHKKSSQESNGLFGWGSDGFIGTSLQLSGWRKDWGKCFFELRLLPQLEIAKKWGVDQNSIVEISPILIDYLSQHDPFPCLVHGDLWSGNASVQTNGKGIIFDPASWWADREVDIAMTKMFGGFSDEFYNGYESIWPLDESSNKRIEIYNLYHLLNHANLFGGSYIQQSIESLQRLTKTIRFLYEN